MIDEKKLIDTLRQYYDKVLHQNISDDEKLAKHDMLSDVMVEIKGQPKIGGWIPTEEKLPPDGQKVLLSCNYMMFDYVTVGTIKNGNRGESYIADEDTFMRSGIIAWQPLPEAYHE